MLFAGALAPDRAPLADEWGYHPRDGARASTNPPSMTWVHEKEAAGYGLQWADNPEFRNAGSVQVPWSAYTHSSPLKAGTWYWRYRIVDSEGKESAWSQTRRFRIDPDAVVFAKPTLRELKNRIPERHPRLFVRREDLVKLKAYIQGAGREPWEKLLARADGLAAGHPTAEPSVRASARDAATNQYWWSNRVQTLRAAFEAETLAFVFLLTGEEKYREAARRYLLSLARWDADGPTNFTLNCEAAKPLVHRLARAYDWAFDALSEAERAEVRRVLKRRGEDAWNSWEALQGKGHLNQPYGSHANRLWHKLAENAVATIGEIPDADQWLDFAVTKFYAAYPVWADEDGGWHEGLSYLAGYMSKAAWWMDLSRTPLGIDAFQKPFFRQLGDYALYSAPPGSPDLGMGDLSFRPPGQGWSFLHYYVKRTGNPYWAWWLREWGVEENFDEPALGFLWGAITAAPPRAPTALPVSKVFRETGVAVLNTTLLSSAGNVQVRFKSSPAGRWSHGHEPNNSFTLNAYGEQLLVNNVYRDLYGSPFHKGWVWSTEAQNALLFERQGQRPRAREATGKIVAFRQEEGFDYVAGDATVSYDGKLKKALRHVFFVKPDLVVFLDEAEAPLPGHFQWMLHGQKEFELDIDAGRLRLDREKAGVEVFYSSEAPLQLRQWTGYEPEPDHRYLKSINSPGIPPQWHVEASATVASASTFTLTVARVYRPGQRLLEPANFERREGTVLLRSGGVIVEMKSKGPELASVKKGNRSWRVIRELE